MRKIVLCILAGGALVTAALFAVYWREAAPSRTPALAPVAPLAPVKGASTIVVPVSVALTAVRAAIEAQAPQNLEGQQDNPFSDLLTNGNIRWSVGRGALSLAVRDDRLIMSTALVGKAHLSGAISNTVGNIAGTLGGILNQSLGQDLQRLTGQTIGQDAGFRGNLRITSRPVLTPNWRIDANLGSEVSIAQAYLTFGGVPIEVGEQIKPLLDQSIDQQVTDWERRLNKDSSLEKAVRREWSSLCRSFSLKRAAIGLPDLWLEIRPTRAFAAQPRMDASSVLLSIGIQAETRIVPGETKPACAFPAKLDILPATEPSRINIAIPIDIPFATLNELLAAQLAGKTFPEDRSAPVAITVERAKLAASGDRLLISLHVKAKEGKSWLGLTDEGDIHFWGRPVLDADQQILRFTDMEIDVESQAAFGLVGKVTDAALPFLRDTLAEQATIDLKLFTTDAEKQIAAAIAEFSREEPGFRVDAAVTDIRLTGIAFDASTLRVFTEVNGSAKVVVSSFE